jgi:hypothetical protein
VLSGALRDLLGHDEPGGSPPAPTRAALLPQSGVRCRCPERRPPPLARTSRNNVTASGTYLDAAYAAVTEMGGKVARNRIFV